MYKYIALKDDTKISDSLMRMIGEKKVSMAECPYTPGLNTCSNSFCWVIYEGLFGVYKIRECVVDYIWYTNIWGLCFDNGWKFTMDQIGKRIFSHENLDCAIKACIELNKKRKVKIKYYH